MTAKIHTRISQHRAINSRWNSMTINAESTLIIYTMMDLKLAVNIQGRLQSNQLGQQFSMCHLHAPQQPEGKQTLRNYSERTREESNTIATILQNHVPNCSTHSFQKGWKSHLERHEGQAQGMQWLLFQNRKNKKVLAVKTDDSWWRERNVLAEIRNWVEDKVKTELLVMLYVNTRAPRAPEHEVESQGTKLTVKKCFCLMHTLPQDIAEVRKY